MAISNLGTGLRTGVCTSTTRPTTPYKGQHIYETDTDTEYVWNGTAWAGVTFGGNVSALGRGEFRTDASAGRGVGIAGGTGDTTAILQFINHNFNAQWATITATNGVLTLNANSITTSTPITGSIVQVVSTPFTSGYTNTNTSATPADITGFTMSITPTKTGNKIIILVQIAAYAICDGYIQLKKNGTIVANPLLSLPRVDFIYDDPSFYAQYVDTAASTSPITYQFSGKATGCNGVLSVNGQGGVSSTIMIEVQS